MTSCRAIFPNINWHSLCPPCWPPQHCPSWTISSAVSSSKIKKPDIKKNDSNAIRIAKLYGYLMILANPPFLYLNPLNKLSYIEMEIRGIKFSKVPSEVFLSMPSLGRRGRKWMIGLRYMLYSWLLTLESLGVFPYILLFAFFNSLLCFICLEI